MLWRNRSRYCKSGSLSLGPGVKWMLVVWSLGTCWDHAGTTIIHACAQPCMPNRRWQSLQQKMKKMWQSLNKWRLGGWVGWGEVQLLTSTSTISKHSANMAKHAQVAYPSDLESFDELEEAPVEEAWWGGMLLAP